MPAARFFSLLLFGCRLCENTRSNATVARQKRIVSRPRNPSLSREARRTLACAARNGAKLWGSSILSPPSTAQPHHTPHTAHSNTNTRRRTTPSRQGTVHACPPRRPFPPRVRSGSAAPFSSLLFSSLFPMAGRQPQRPNLLVTGTPGVGKTSLCKALAECTQMEHLNVGDIVKEHGFVVEKDLEFDTLIPDEDPLLDYMEDLLVEGGKIVDYHSSELFPERWFQLVVVLRCTTESLFDRLTARGYSEKKRDENMQCEIIGVSSEEAKESYTSCPVWELPSNSVDDQETVLEKLQEWAGQNGLGEQ